jgi:CheY-like chemotaxis protein
LKNQFMANMSHELRTPLNSIIGFSRVMLKGIDGPITEMQETDLEAIYDSGRHLLNLINDILDISKINAGKMEVIFEPVDLGALVESVMSTAMGFVKDKPVKLLTDMPDDLPNIVADSRRIRQVLINLLGNAGKFTEEGFIKVSASWDDYQVLISVQDTGIGIPADRIHAVFEQFEQVDSSSSRRYQGTGLGVPLSREFVRMHGGDMWIQQSVVGEGTTFCFSLPIGGPDAVEEMGPASDSAQGRVVLTVDDDASVITLFRRYLEQHGYKVFGLTRGDRVLEEAIRLKPYAITLDVLMPGRDGWSVIRELKSNPATHDIPIIICSVLGERDRGISMGVADYLTKPISEQALLDTLAHLGDGNGAGRGGSGGTCLVVDDNPDDRKLLRRLLENAGYDVSEAVGGAAAITQIDREAPGLVILDLMMPEVDGFEVLEHLKRDEATRGIPVVVVTAKELTQEDRVRLQQRVEALLQKGLFDQQQLLSDVRAALNRLAV